VNNYVNHTEKNKLNLFIITYKQINSKQMKFKILKTVPVGTGHAYNPSMLETVSGGFCILGQLGVQIKTLSEKKSQSLQPV
jgi:hypothetical protein